MAWRCSSVVECLPSMCKALGPSGTLLKTTQTHTWLISNTSLSKARFQAEVQGIATGDTLFSFFLPHYFLVSYPAVTKSTRKMVAILTQKKNEFFFFLLLDIGIDPRQGLGHAKHTVLPHDILLYSQPLWFQNNKFWFSSWFVDILSLLYDLGQPQSNCWSSCLQLSARNHSCAPASS